MTVTKPRPPIIAAEITVTNHNAGRLFVNIHIAQEKARLGDIDDAISLARTAVESLFASGRRRRTVAPGRRMAAGYRASDRDRPDRGTLRHKLGHEVIHTVYNLGYRLGRP